VPAGDPRAWRTLGELTDHADGVEGVRVVSDAGGAGDSEVNALQRLARVAVGERADIATAEALWKGTPAVTGVGGLEELGASFATPAERGAQVAELVADAGLAVELGRVGRELVRRRHLVTRLLVDELELYARIVSER
jgi:trehalose synthase